MMIVVFVLFVLYTLDSVAKGFIEKLRNKLKL